MSAYSIYPNPVSATLFFELSPTAQANDNVLPQAGTCKVQIFSAQTGALVFDQTVSNFSSNFNLNVSTLPDGVYLVRLMQDNTIVQMQTVLIAH